MWCHDLLNVDQLEALIEKNFFLHKSARAAYMAYVNAYAQHSLKDVFNVRPPGVIFVHRPRACTHVAYCECVC